jgi:two-component system LytT family response regulator
MSKLRLLIVDDEPLIRLGIRAGLATLPDLEIVGECESGMQAIRAIEVEKPDLVMLDVQMPDGSGLDVVREIGTKRMPMVIFVTAYDEYAVKAFELNAVDYLLKPFDEERLQRSVERAQDRLQNQSHTVLTQQLQALLEAKQTNWPERIVVKSRDRYEFVGVDSIDWVESADNYVQLHCGAKEFLLNESISGLEKKLNPKQFMRIHRRHIVNLSQVLRISPLLSGSYEVEIRGGTRLNTGKQYKPAIQNLIGRRTD